MTKQEYVVNQPHHIEAKPLRLPGYQRQPTHGSIKLLAAEDNYTKVHLFEQIRPLLVCQTLKLFADQMPDFVRANKATLVNPNVIRKVIVLTPKHMVLELATGELIGVSRRRMETVLAQLSLPPLAPNKRPPRPLPTQGQGISLAA